MRIHANHDKGSKEVLNDNTMVGGGYVLCLIIMIQPIITILEREAFLYSTRRQVGKLEIFLETEKYVKLQKYTIKARQRKK